MCDLLVVGKLGKIYVCDREEVDPFQACFFQQFPKFKSNPKLFPIINVM